VGQNLLIPGVLPFVELQPLPSSTRQIAASRPGTKNRVGLQGDENGDVIHVRVERGET